MSFTSTSFVLFFLPLFLACYFATPAHFRNITLLAESYLFYGWWRLDFLLLLVGVSVWTYGVGQVMVRAPELRRNLWCGLGIAGCLLVLLIFKYLDFFIESFAGLLGVSPEDLGVHWKILFPIGISFYVFHSISYLIDVRKEQAEPARSFIDFATFLALFPQLMAGPILRYRDLAVQMVSRTVTWDSFAQGWLRFVLGLGKKVIIADSLAIVVDTCFAAPQPTLMEAWLGSAAFMLQVYFDFSGYSSMAIGMALMLGFRFGENFRFPFHARSFSEVWQRWHISLSQWLFCYLYQPMARRLRGKRGVLANLMIVSMAGGVWHGANFTFVFWGGWKGVLLVADRAFGWLRKDRSAWYGTAGVIVLMAIGGAMFRAENFGHGLQMFGGMAGLNGIAIRPEIWVQMGKEALVWLFLAIGITAAEPRLERWASYLPAKTDVTWDVVLANAGRSILALVVCVAVYIETADHTYKPFLYYQF